MSFGTEVASLFGTLDLQDNATKTLEGFGSGLDQAADKLKSIGSGLIQTGSQLTLLTAPITAFLGTSIKAASEQQAAQSQLQAVLKSTAGVAGVTQQAATDLANSLSRVTRFSDDATLGAENMLLTFTSIGKDIFPDVTKTALDMSQALGQDLKSSAIQLGKALNDPTQGMTALRRVGVQFTDAQEKQIKTMQASGDLMGAQSLILKELQREFGGSAEAAGKTFAGQMDILNHRFQQFQEKIGGIIMPLLGKLMDKISPLIDKVSDWVDKNPQLAQTILIVAGAVAVAGPVLVALGIAISGIGTAVAAVGAVLGSSLLLPITAVVAAVIGLKKAYDDNFLGIRDTVNGVIATLTVAFHQFAPLVKDVADAFTKGGLIGAINQFFAGLEDGSTLVTKFLETLGVMPSTAQKISDAFGKVVGVIDDLVMGAIHAVEYFVAGFQTNIQTIPFYIQYYFGRIWSVVQPSLQKIADWFTGSGTDSLSGALSSVDAFITQNVIAPLKGIWIAVQPALQPILNWFNGSGGGDSSLRGAINAVQTTVTDLGNSLRALGNTPFFTGVRAFFQPLLDLINEIFNKAADSWEMLRRIGGGTPQRALPGEISPGVIDTGSQYRLAAPVGAGQYGPQLGGKPQGGVFAANFGAAGANNPFAAPFYGVKETLGGSGTPFVNAGTAYGVYGGYQGGARANGGPVNAGESYLVGERGPEVLRMGAQSGNITPNNRLGTRIDTMHFNFPNVTDATTAESFRDIVHEVLANL